MGSLCKVNWLSSRQDSNGDSSSRSTCRSNYFGHDYIAAVCLFFSAIKSSSVRAWDLLCTGIALLPIALCALVGSPQAAIAQAQITGQWNTLSYLMPINPIRMALLHTGKIVIVAGSENYPTEHDQGTSVSAVWDLAAQTITVQPMLWDVFCNGGSFFTDGRCVVIGGTVQYDPFYGEPRVTVFDALTEEFNELESMADGRWYASGITLGDGRVMVYSGYDSTGAVNQTVEIYTVGSGWSTPYNAGWTPPLYPWLTLLPNGTVFFSGSTAGAQIFNPNNPTAGWTFSSNQYYYLTRTYGNPVLLPLLPANNYAPRVMILGGGQPDATATTEIIDLSKTNPAWAPSGNMPSGARVEGNTVLLPNGKLLAQGGSAVDEDATTATLGADLYDPSTGTWSSAGTATYPRLYHSTALLLPDATVAVAGSNPVRGTYEQHIEIYSPAYLFTTDTNGNTIPATRPVIQSAPTNIGYGAGTFQVQTPNAPNTSLPDVNSVVLMRPGSDTHAYDMEQRMVGLTFTPTSGALTVTFPPNQNIAPPGYYMLFLLNHAGVPSIASFVQVSNNPTDQPPKGTITAPAGNMTVQAGQPVTFTGTGSDPNGVISKYAWIFPGGSPTTSTAQNPGAVTFPAAGTYAVSLTAIDTLGVNDPSPPVRTITVQGSSPTPKYIQGNYATPQTSQTKVTVPYTAAQATGDLNAVIVGWNDTKAKVSSVKDSKGNTYQLALGPTLLSGLLSQSVYYAKNIAAAAASANTVTVTFTAAASYPDIRILEYSGLDPANPLDVAVGATGSAITSNSGALTTTNPTDLILGANIVESYTIGPGSGYTQRMITSPDGDIAEDWLVTSTGSYSATAPLGATGGWVTQAVAFRAASAVAPPPPPPPPPPPGPAFVQGNYACPQTPQKTVTIPYTAAQTAANLNMVVVGWNDTTATISSVTDTKGNVYQLAVGPTLVSGTLSQSIYYAKNIVTAGAGVNAVTVTFNTAASYPDIRILEYSGLDTVKPLDAVVGTTGNGTMSSSGTAPTTSPTDMLVGANIVESYNTGPGTWYVQRLLTNPDGDIVEDWLVNSTGTYSATAPLGAAGAWVMQMVAFRALSGGG